MVSDIIINDIHRDCWQGKYGNRIPLDNPKQIEIYRLWALLKLYNENHPGFSYGAVEMGGADPQVSAVFRNVDFTKVMEEVAIGKKLTYDNIIAQISKKDENYAEIIKQKVEDAITQNHDIAGSVDIDTSELTIRPLWRGANGWMLEPKHRDELKHLIKQAAKDTARRHLLDPAKNPECLRIKVFDSQDVIGEVESTVDIVKELQDEGYKIGVEVGLSYSQGKNCDPELGDHEDFYPDEFYVNKVREAAILLKEKNLPLDKCRISLKDMTGELSAEAAKRLFPKFIEVLKEEGVNIALGTHLHNTGLAKDAYVEAIKACRKAEWPINVDTVDGKEYQTGFVSTLDLNEALQAEGIELGMTDSEKAIIERITALTDELAEEYSVVRVDETLSGEEMRLYKIAGGAFKSMQAEVIRIDIAGKLGVSQQEALHIMGHALIASRRLMGQPFGVTPGFQNTQIAALTLLDNMMKQEHIKKDMSFDTIKKQVIKRLSKDEINKFFIKNMKPVVQEFLRGNMPCKIDPTVDEYIEKVFKSSVVFLDNMVQKKAINNQMSFPEIEKTIITVLDDFEEGSKYLEEGSDIPLANLKDNILQIISESNIKEFLSEGQNDFDQLVTQINTQFADLKGKRKGVLTDGKESTLEKAQAEVKKLQDEGYIKPRHSHALIVAVELYKQGKITEEHINHVVKTLTSKENNITYDAPDGQQDSQWKIRTAGVIQTLIDDNYISNCNADKVVEMLAEEAYTSATSWALEVGYNNIRHKVTHPWYKEPDPTEYQNNKKEYDRALAIFNAGFNPMPDNIERIRKAYLYGRITGAETLKLLIAEFIVEQDKIKQHALQYIASNPEQIYNAAETIKTLSTLADDDKLKQSYLRDLAKDFYYNYRNSIKTHIADTGERPLYQESIAMNIAFNFMKEEMAKISGCNSKTDHENISKVMHYMKNLIDSSEARMSMPAEITEILVKKGDKVEKGQVLFKFRALKMEFDFIAECDGTVGEILAKKGSVVPIGETIIKLDNPELQLAPLEYIDRGNDGLDGQAKISNDYRIANDNIKNVITNKSQTSQQEIEYSSNKPVNDNILDYNLYTKSDTGKYRKINNNTHTYDDNIPLYRKKLSGEYYQIDRKEYNQIIQQQRGYNRTDTLSTNPVHQAEYNDNVIHVVGNRTGCATKIIGDLGINADVHILHIKGDESTPIVENFPEAKRHLVSNFTDENNSTKSGYMNQKEIIEILTQLAKDNPNKTIHFHPGWGFLAEDASFVEKVEELAKTYQVKFVGPNSEMMKMAGNKFDFREVVQEVAPEFNPTYFKVTESLEDLEGYVENNFENLAKYIRSGFDRTKHTDLDTKYQDEFKKLCDSIAEQKKDNSKNLDISSEKRKREIEDFSYDDLKTVEENYKQYVSQIFKNRQSSGEKHVNQYHALDVKYRQEFDKICRSMNKDVMIKAVSGGGGRGIKGFKYNDMLDYEENYQQYISSILKTRRDGRLLFGDDTVMVEQRIRGNTHHYEIQFGTANGKGINLGMRNCSAQNDGQKFIEVNVIEGDYSPALIDKINTNANEIINKLAQKGYRGVGTLELIVNPTTEEVRILETNTRIQVEHPVTEKDILCKTGISISMPQLNHFFATNNKGQSPQEILREVYGFRDEHFTQMTNPGTERVVHYRINSKFIDFIKGKSSPGWFEDKMWANNLASHIAKETGANLMIGGLGDGTCDSQIGALIGTHEQASKALKELSDMFKSAQIADRNYNANTNVDIVPVIEEALFDDRNLNQEFSTSTVDNLLDNVNYGNFTVIDKDKGSILPGEIDIKNDNMNKALKKVYTDKDALCAEFIVNAYRKKVQHDYKCGRTISKDTMEQIEKEVKDFENTLWSSIVSDQTDINHPVWATNTADKVDVNHPLWDHAITSQTVLEPLHVNSQYRINFIEHRHPTKDGIDYTLNVRNIDPEYKKRVENYITEQRNKPIEIGRGNYGQYIYV